MQREFINSLQDRDLTDDEIAKLYNDGVFDDTIYVGTDEFNDILFNQPRGDSSRSEYSNMRNAKNELDRKIVANIDNYFIDGGSSFRDFNEDRHTNACGWLAIHAGLHFGCYFRMLPSNLVAAFRNGECNYPYLKQISQSNSKTECITDGNIDNLARVLGINIIVQDLDECRQHNYGNYKLYIHLKNEHYRFLVHDHRWDKHAEKFVKDMSAWYTLQKF